MVLGGTQINSLDALARVRAFFIPVNTTIMPATMQAIPAPFMVYEINPTYAGCEVKYRDIFGQDHTYQITNSEQASLFPEFAHEICYYVEEADNKEF